MGAWIAWTPEPARGRLLSDTSQLVPGRLRGSNFQVWGAAEYRVAIQLVNGDCVWVPQRCCILIRHAEAGRIRQHEGQGAATIPMSGRAALIQ